MTLAPLAEAGPVIALHVAAATLALILGPVLAMRRRRDRWHRHLGRIWVAALTVAALTALAIHEIRLAGPFSPIHLLVPLTLVSLWRGLTAIRRGDRVGHGRAMAALYGMALALPGALTLLPGRRLNIVLFGVESWAGFGAGAAVLALAAAPVWRAAPRRETPFSSAAPSAKAPASAVVAELVDAQR